MNITPKVKLNKKVLEPEIEYVRNTDALKKLKLKAQFNTRVNIFIGKKLTEKEKSVFFKKSTYEDTGCIYVHYKKDQFWSTILRDLGIAKSISEAKGAGWHRKVEAGFQDIYLDGLKNITGIQDYHNSRGYHPHRITILKEDEKN